MIRELDCGRGGAAVTYFSLSPAQDMLAAIVKDHALASFPLHTLSSFGEGENKFSGVTDTPLLHSSQCAVVVQTCCCRAVPSLRCQPANTGE